MINAIFSSSADDSLFLSYYTMFALLMFNFTFCMIAAFFIHVLIEAPLMNLILSGHIKKEEMKDRDGTELYYYDDVAGQKEEVRLTEVLEEEQKP